MRLKWYFTCFEILEFFLLFYLAYLEVRIYFIYIYFLILLELWRSLSNSRPITIKTNSSNQPKVVFTNKLSL